MSDLLYCIIAYLATGCLLAWLTMIVDPSRPRGYETFLHVEPVMSYPVVDVVVFLLIMLFWPIVSVMYAWLVLRMIIWRR